MIDVIDNPSNIIYWAKIQQEEDVKKLCCDSLMFVSVNDGLSLLG